MRVFVKSGVSSLSVLLLAAATLFRGIHAAKESKSQGSAFASRKALHTREYYEAAFYDWMTQHKIKIAQGPAYVQRLNNFIENSDMIELHNNRNASYTLEHNRFSHLTYEEFQQYYLGWIKPIRLDDMEEITSAVTRSLRGGNSKREVPDAVDWVEKGAVTSVKDQGQCGSCYTFSATGAIEGAYAIQTGELVELSMQQIVDCDDLDGGCQGGEMQQAFHWVRKNGGLCTLQNYPYTSGEGGAGRTCNGQCQVVDGTAPKLWKTVTPNSPTALVQALAERPVSVAVAASKDWMFYKEGIYTGSCKTQLNHGILAVGYGESADGLPYWKVKNSWGTKWGMEGYILLGRTDDHSACGILDDASYPILSLKETPSTSTASAASSSAAAVVNKDVEVDLTSKGSASAVDCGGGTAIFPTITISPDNVAKNQLVTVQAEGILNKPTFSGTYTISVQYEGTELYSHSGNACGTEKVTLPLNVGIINLYGFECPANPGPVKYGLDVKLPTIAPSGGYDIKITAVDQDQVSLICITAKLNL